VQLQRSYSQSSAKDVSDVIITPALSTRRKRFPNHAAENAALVALAQELANDSQSLFERLASTALELCQAGTAGLSLLENRGEAETFTYNAVAGVYADLQGGLSPRDFSPWGTTLDEGAPQLFSNPGRYFSFFADIDPQVVEALVVPIYGAEPRALGAIWVFSHGTTRSFDAEDVRILSALANFTAAALRGFQTQERLVSLIRTRDEFLSIASHELKTPLTSLKLQTQLRQRKLLKSGPEAFCREKWVQMFQSDDKQFTRLTNLIEDMLDISRIDSGRLALEYEEFDLCDLARDVTERLSAQIANSGSPLSLVLEGPLRGEWDRYRLEQVLINLLTNACRYGSGKPIEVRVFRQGAKAVIQVHDNGIGIAKEHRERIFDRFERAISAAERSGLGLGLYISRNIVELHGGSILLIDSEPGQGSIFLAELPLKRPN
jgi:signal transduction histidine kinase